MTAAASRPRGARFRALRRRALAAALVLPAAAAPAQEAANRGIRIGLADSVPAARLGAAAPFELRAGELAIETAWVLISPETGPAEPVLALGSFDTEDGAERAAESRRAASGGAAGGGPPSVRIRRNPENGRYLAVLPPARGEPPAAAVRRLREEGFPGAGLFDLPEPVGDALVLRPVGGSPIRIPGGVALTAVPPPGAFLEWEGRPYRGSLTVVRSGAGVTVVNELPLEDYLLGVVPRELPPDLFPELEALKAQALAARTYALRPRDTYLERGYDLCSGPACQVYGGVGAERPLSSRAVRETAGEALFHDGRLIDALYTAACGGATENAENIFTTKTPYLVGRACIRDSGGLRLESAGAAPLDAALVRASGLLPPGWGGADALDALAVPAGAAEAEGLLRETARRLGAPVCDLPDAPPGSGAAPLTLGAFAESAQALRCRPAPSEGPGAGVSPFGPTEGEMPPAVRALLDEGLLNAGERGLAPDRPVTRREVLFAAAALLRREAPPFRRGQVRGIEGGTLLVEEDGETPPGGPSAPSASTAEAPLLRLTPAETEPWLYRETVARRIPGRGDPPPAAAPVLSLTVRLGDFVRFLAPAGEGGDPAPDPAADGEASLRFEALILEDLGATWDRFSRQRSWLVPKDAAALAQAAARQRPIGDLLALEPLEYGVSGRIVRLRLVGSEGSLEVRGLGVRRLLGLSDNLFFAEPRRDPSGRLTGFWFTGRGWGHGLGLCQAGAYGMAAAGADYREILTHYYAGVEIRR